MKRLALVRLLAVIFGMVTFLMFPPFLMALARGEDSMLRAFLIPMILGFALTLPAIIFLPNVSFNLRPKDGFLLVFLTWIFASIAGSLPYHFSPVHMSYFDAIFESSCGFATTGATTFFDVESLPRSLLLWRSISHWAGGMGIILLTVALMPLLGVGGFQLIKAEVPGPDKERITPKMTSAAKILWGTYFIFSVVLILLYRVGGMEWFDAVCHGFTVIATGGASTKNTGFAFYDSAFIDWVTVVFMLLGALNFNMYYKIVKRKFRDVAENTEGRVYFCVFIIAALAITVSLVPQYGSFADALRFGSFQAASILTTTGNTRVDYTAWPSLAQGILLCLMCVGGCSGSTAGGIKVIRYTVLFKQAGNEIRRILYPQGVFSIYLNKKVGRKDVVYGVAGFVFLYLAVVTVTAVVTAMSGFDLFSSVSAALAFTGNIGTGFGALAPFRDCSAFPNHLKLFYSLVMIAGRLELWTVIVLLTPEYWRR